MRIKFQDQKPDHIPDDLYQEAKAMRAFFNDKEKYEDWIRHTAESYGKDLDEAEKGAIKGIAMAHENMKNDRGEEQAEWFKDFVGLQRFLDAYEQIKGELIVGRH